MQSAPEVMAQLALDYSKKLSELENLISKISGESILPQLRALGERSSGRFRAAQRTLLEMLTSGEPVEGDAALGVVTALCVCFDEMHILFQTLLEQYAKVKADESAT